MVASTIVPRVTRMPRVSRYSFTVFNIAPLQEPTVAPVNLARSRPHLLH